MGHCGPSPEHLVVSKVARAGQKESSVREESHDQPNSKKAAPPEVLRGLVGEDPMGKAAPRALRQKSCWPW